jgi:hypothetical protein
VSKDGQVNAAAAAKVWRQFLIKKGLQIDESVI